MKPILKQDETHQNVKEFLLNSKDLLIDLPHKNMFVGWHDGAEGKSICHADPMAWIQCQEHAMKDKNWK